MGELALAADYNGFLAKNGQPSSAAIAAIERLRMSGRRARFIDGSILSSYSLSQAHPSSAVHPLLAQYGFVANCKSSQTLSELTARCVDRG